LKHIICLADRYDPQQKADDYQVKYYTITALVFLSISFII